MRGISPDLWTIHPHPLNGEILSSWMVRLAHAYGYKVQTFYNLVFGRRIEIWNRDIDRSASIELLEALARHTGTPFEVVKATTLAAYEGSVFDYHDPNRYTHWVLPAGIYHRKRRRFSMQYCSVCLAIGEIPYFRRFWRLGFITRCPEHGNLLKDCCSTCGAPVVFHRAELGRRWETAPVSIRLCWKCRADLAHETVEVREPIDWKTSVARKNLWLFAELGWGFAEKRTLQYARLYFEPLWMICHALLGKPGRWNASTRPIAALPFPEFENYLPRLGRRAHMLDYRIADRDAVIELALWVLEDFPSRLMAFAKPMRICFSHFANGREEKDISGWLELSAEKWRIATAISRKRVQEVPSASSS